MSLLYHSLITFYTNTTKCILLMQNLMGFLLKFTGTKNYNHSLRYQQKCNLVQLILTLLIIAGPVIYYMLLKDILKDYFLYFWEQFWSKNCHLNHNILCYSHNLHSYQNCVLFCKVNDQLRTLVPADCCIRVYLKSTCWQCLTVQMLHSKFLKTIQTVLLFMDGLYAGQQL